MGEPSWGPTGVSGDTDIVFSLSKRHTSSRGMPCKHDMPRIIRTRGFVGSP